MALKLQDMARPKKSLSGNSIGDYKPSPYSYDHRVNLNTDDLDKLGVDTPKVGDKFHVLAEAHVKSTDQSESENGDKSHRVELQLKKMALQKRSQKKPSMLDAVNAGIKEANDSAD